MTLTVAEKNRPIPEKVDEMCLDFDTKKSTAEAAQQKLSEAKGILLTAIEAYGYQPAGAPKTKRLEGGIYIADQTTGSSNEIVEAKVNELRSELSRLTLSKVFPQLFATVTTHSLMKNAASTLKIYIGGLDSETQAHVLGIFAQCINVKVKAPSVSVDLVATLREKEAEAAEKAARKAEREAKRAAKTAKKK
ncbi:MAG: hypothetical protein P4K83_02240 [Terracidiphilus sp.]|nr:hypothetical protein [Terracidiphilus sp.]